VLSVPRSGNGITAQRTGVREVRTDIVP